MMNDELANFHEGTGLDANELKPSQDQAALAVSTPQTELNAFNQIVTAMNALPQEAKPRVMKSVITLLGFNATVLFPASQPQQGSARSSSVPSASQSTFSEDRTPSAKAFMAEKKPVTDIEKIACLGYYLTHYQNTPHFKALDLSKLNTEAAQIKFSNVSVAVDNATSTGLLVQAGKGAKQISAIGELYVQALPDREAAKAAIAHVRPRKKSKRGGFSKEEESANSK
jgi:hypothetical protein